MKGFKNTTGMRSGFNFGSSAGFTGSTGKVQNISYTRRTPQRKKFAEGGPVVRPERPAVRGSSVAGKGAFQALRDSMPRGLRGKQLDRVERRVNKAEGGSVGNALHGPINSSALDQASGVRHGLRPGFTRGGYAPKYAKGGRIPADKAAARAIKSHVATPAPKGHKGLKSC